MIIIKQDKEGLYTLTDSHKTIWVGDSEFEFHQANFKWEVKLVDGQKTYIFTE